MFKHSVAGFTLMLLSILGSDISAEPISMASFASHDISLTLNVSAQTASIADRGEVEVKTGWNMFYLNTGAKLSQFVLNGSPADYDEFFAADTLDMPLDIRPELPELEPDGDHLLVLFETDESGVTSFEIEFTAVFDDPVENTRFSRENIGNEVSGTIIEQGAYLSPAAHYYPMGDEELARFRVTADIPAEWHCVADGNRVSSEVVDGRRVETYANPYTNDGCMFMAAPYVIRSIVQDGVEVACYFFEADTALIDGYLEASAGYLKMYSEMIGPYPFERFTVAENFFPTGYGMPAWTLLGQQVLRLPFIKATSLGHEVLHNWWGNSVYVDYERGNWCEGATVYGADYHYKLNESEEAAKAYRKDILKAYDSYVNDGNDFPIREFKSRTSAGERTIGYSKVMMVYHMIEEEIGSEAFWAAWPLIYERYIGKKISWEEWIETFEETSGRDLSWVIPQWIDRAGAPMLSVELGQWQSGGDPGYKKVSLLLSQEPDNDYRVKVPIHFDGEEVNFDTSVTLGTPTSEFHFRVPGTAASATVDPDYDIFRRLHPEEIEPIISAVMGTEYKRFISFEDNGISGSSFRSFAENLAGGEVKIESPDVLKESSEFAPVGLNPGQLPPELTTWVLINDTSITIDSTEYLREGHTIILAGTGWSGESAYLIVLTEDFGSLPRLGQLIPHYGKYSYLVFEGTRNIGKGQWPVTGSPLSVGLIPIRGID